MSDAPAELAKQQRAYEIIATEDFALSYQVLMEVWNVATRKMKTTVPPAKVAAFLELALAHPCVAGTPVLIWREAVRLSGRYGLHPYDAAIIAAARELGIMRVYSEDMAHGQNYDGVTVVNPFKTLTS